MRTTKQRQRKNHSRKGAAAAEFALCLPPLILLVFASIEACNAIFLSHSVCVASYEATRVAVQPNSTNAQALASANGILADRNVTDGTVTFSPSDVSTVARGQIITVTVSAPCDANSILPRWFFTGRTLSSNITMVKE